MPKGWKAVVGGSAGAVPSIAEVLAEDLDDDKAMDLADRAISYYKNCDTTQRLGRYIKKIGLEEFRKEIGVR
jgi:NAD(P)H-nitrite reductase large subunit